MRLFLKRAACGPSKPRISTGNRGTGASEERSGGTCSCPHNNRSSGGGCQFLRPDLRSGPWKVTSCCCTGASLIGRFVLIRHEDLAEHDCSPQKIGCAGEKTRGIHNRRDSSSPTRTATGPPTDFLAEHQRAAAPAVRIDLSRSLSCAGIYHRRLPRRQREMSNDYKLTLAAFALLALMPVAANAQTTNN